MGDDFKKNILNTFCYYDVLNYPLTLFEVWKHLLANEEINTEGNIKITLKNILLSLEDPDLKRFIDSEDGMYFLRGKNNLVRDRINRSKISLLKIKKMKRISKALFIIFAVLAMGGLSG
jgi:hypothetical protein